MKGKYAARAARREESALSDEVTALRAQVAEAREHHHAEVQALKAEIARLKVEAARAPSAVAEAEAERARTNAVKAEKTSGIVLDNAAAWLEQKDDLVRDACRYISMTTGSPPELALEVVWTWITGSPLEYGFVAAPDLLKWGIHPKGWVDRVFRSRAAMFQRRCSRHNARLARRDGADLSDGPVSLDRAEEIAEDPAARGHEYFRERVHADYRKWRAWYKAVTDEDFELLAELAAAER